MANYCIPCGRRYTGWECPDCRAAAAVAAQEAHAAQAARDAAAQREATDRLRDEIADAAERAEEAMEERRLDAERQAADLRDALEAAADEQRENIANSWALQSETHCQRAVDLWSADLYDEGLRHAERAVALDSGNLRAHIFHGELLGKTGRSSEQGRSWETQIKLLRLDRFATPWWADYVLRFVARGSPAEARLLAFIDTAPLSGAAPAWRELIRLVFDRGHVQIAGALWTKVPGSNHLLLAADGVRLSPVEGERRLDDCLRAIPFERRSQVAEFYAAVQQDRWLRASDKEQIRLRIANAYRTWSLQGLGPKVETFFVPKVLLFSAVEGALIAALVYFGASSSAVAIVAGLAAANTLNVVRILAANRRRVSRTFTDACEAFVIEEGHTWDAVLEPGRVGDIVSRSLSVPGAGAQVKGLVCAVLLAAVAAYFGWRNSWADSEAPASPVAQRVSGPSRDASSSSRSRRATRSPAVSPADRSARRGPSSEVQPVRSTSVASLSIEARAPSAVSRPPEADIAPDEPAAVRISGAMRPPVKTKHVPPEYPADAREHGVQGTVIIEATIAQDGSVKSARVVRSIPLLDAAALAAVKQWEFLPTTVDGRPVSVVATYTVNFTF